MGGVLRVKGEGAREALRGTPKRRSSGGGGILWEGEC